MFVLLTIRYIELFNHCVSMSFLKMTILEEWVSSSSMNFLSVYYSKAVYSTVLFVITDWCFCFCVYQRSSLYLLYFHFEISFTIQQDLNERKKGEVTSFCSIPDQSKSFGDYWSPSSITYNEWYSVTSLFGFVSLTRFPYRSRGPVLPFWDPCSG